MLKKILLIEDEDPIRRVLSKILTEENENYILTEAEDGKSGLDKSDLAREALWASPALIW